MGISGGPGRDSGNQTIYGWFNIRVRTNNYLTHPPRQQIFRAMNGAHLASPVRGERLVMLIGPTWEPNLLPYWALNLGPIIGKQDVCPNGCQISVQQFGQL